MAKLEEMSHPHATNAGWSTLWMLELLGLLGLLGF
jgi:hypothetical protein